MCATYETTEVRYAPYARGCRGTLYIFEGNGDEGITYYLVDISICDGLGRHTGINLKYFLGRDGTS